MAISETVILPETNSKNDSHEQTVIIDDGEYEYENEHEYHVTENIIIMRQVLGALLGLFHCICGGILSGFSSILMAQYKHNPSAFTISEEEASWIASIVVIPMAPACLIASIFINKLPKRVFAALLALVEIAGWLIIYYSTTITALLVGRLLTGVASAGGAPIIPQFIGETSDPKLRGAFLGSVLLGISLGVLIIHVLGAFLAWQTCVVVTVGVLVIYLSLVLYVKEPYGWYLRNHALQDAKRSFCWYRGAGVEARREIAKFISAQHENTCADYTLSQMATLCRSRLLLRPLAVSATLMATMHFSGSKAIMFYSISILSRTVPSLDEYASTVTVDAIRIAMTLLGAMLIQRHRVRPLLIVSGVGATVSHFFFALFMYLAQINDDGGEYNMLALLALIAYIMFSSIGIASLPWVICGEIFPLIVKGIGCGISTFVYFFSFFVVIKLTPSMFAMFGLPGSFLGFGCLTLLGTSILYFILPETKNKTLKDIEDYFRKQCT